MPIFDLWPIGIQYIYCSLVLIVFLLTAFLLWMNRGYYLDPLLNTRRSTFVIFAAVVLLFFSVSVFRFNGLETFSPSDMEWEEMKFAKQLLSGELVFNHMRHGLVYPLVMAVGFSVFGTNPLFAAYLNLGCLTLSVFLIFILSKELFKDGRIAVAASFLYITTPLVYAFSGRDMGYPAFLSLLLLMFVASGVLYLRHRQPQLLWLASLLAVIASQTKPEYSVIFILLFLLYVLAWDRKKFSLKRGLAVPALLVLFSLPAIDQDIVFKKNFRELNGWCGSPSQTFQDGERIEYDDVPGVCLIDPIVKTVGNERLSFNYFIYDLPNFIKFWTYGSFALMFLFACIGALRLAGEDKKGALFLLSVFIVIAVLYLADCIYYEPRLTFPIVSFVAVMAGAGIGYISTRVSRNKNISRGIILLLCMIILLYWFFPHLWINKQGPRVFYDYHADPGSIGELPDDYTQLSHFLTKAEEPANFIVPQNNQQNILIILGHEAYNLSDMLRMDFVQSPDKQAYFRSLDFPLNPDKNNYFIHSNMYTGTDQLSMICNFILNNFELELVDAYRGEKLYKIKKQH